MTIEQLKKANEIRFKLDKLDYFERMFISNSTVWLVTEKKRVIFKRLSRPCSTNSKLYIR